MPYWLAKIRYPMPEEGDFFDELPLDQRTDDDNKDGDDNKAANKMPTQDERGKRGKK